MTPQVTGGATFGLGVLSSAISGFGKIEAGKEEEKAYDYNADVTALNTSNEVEANQQKTTARIGAQATAYAGAGVDLTSGSPLLIMAATAARGAQEGEEIKEAGDEQSTLDRYYGKIAAFGGTMSGIGSFLQGVSGASSSYGKFLNNPTPTAAPAF